MHRVLGGILLTVSSVLGTAALIAVYYVPTTLRERASEPEGSLALLILVLTCCALSVPAGFLGIRFIERSAKPLRGLSGTVWLALVAGLVGVVATDPLTFMWPAPVLFGCLVAAGELLGGRARTRLSSSA